MIDNSSLLDSYIGGEINNDSFSQQLRNICSLDSVNFVLEIGTGSGDGSTAQIINGMSLNSNVNKQFHSIELSEARSEMAKNKYKNYEFAHFHNGCSINDDEYLTEEQVSNFYNLQKSTLNNFTLQTILNWRQTEIDYIKNRTPKMALIETIKSNFNIEIFDFVLIDGSEFTGYSELKHVYGAKWIALDDIRAAKNFLNFNNLMNDSTYKLHVVENWLRNGFAIFKKI